MNRKKQPAQGEMHAVLQPTHDPSWEEEVTVKIEAKKIAKDVSLIIANEDTKEVLVRYTIPVKYLYPFNQYHCKMLPRKKNLAATKRYVTLVHKFSTIPYYSGIYYKGQEVFIQRVEVNLIESQGSVMAVCNFKAYLQDMSCNLKSGS